MRVWNCWKTAGGVGKISTTNQPGSQQGLRCCSWATCQEDANRTVQPLSDSNSITESVGNLSQYRITATPQISDSLTVINSEAFDPAAQSSRLDRLALDFPLLQPLFSRMFCACKFSSSWENNFLSKWQNHFGTQSTHVKRCLRDTGLFEVQLSLVDHGRSL